MIRGSNTVDNFKQIAEIVEKKGTGIVYRVMSVQMYPEVYPGNFYKNPVRSRKKFEIFYRRRLYFSPSPGYR